MNKIYKIVDGQYFDGDYYTVEDVADGKKKINFSPSATVVEGTVMDSEKFSFMQKNGVYYTNVTHTIDGGKSVYIVEDFEDVGGFGLFGGFKLMIDPSVSCVAGSKVEFLGVRYDIKKTYKGNLIDTVESDISKGLPVILIYDNGIFKLQNVSYENKLDKGNVSEDYDTAEKIENKIESLENILKWKQLENWDYDVIKQTSFSFDFLDIEKEKYSELLIVYDADQTQDYQESRVSKLILEDTGAFFYAQYTNELIRLTINNNTVSANASAGSRAVYYKGVYWR